MEKQQVSSSTLLSVGYDSDTQILEVEFINGNVYEYKNVPQIVYENLMSAPSCGSYFSREISKAYSYSKIE